MSYNFILLTRMFITAQLMYLLYKLALILSISISVCNTYLTIPCGIAEKALDSETEVCI